MQVDRLFKRLTRVRFLVLSGQCLVWLFTAWWQDLVRNPAALWLILVYAAINVLALYYTRQNSASKQLMYWLLIFDVLEFFLFFYFTGGSSNPFLWFFLVPLVVSATALSVRLTRWMTALTIALYTGLLWLDSSGHTSHATMHGGDSAFSQHIIGMWLGFMAIALLLTWLISGLIRDFNRTNRQLLRARALRARNREMVSLGMLAASAAHQLGTPLGTVHMLAQKLQRQMGDNASVHDDLEVMRTQVMRCKAVLQNLTSVSRHHESIQSRIVHTEEFMRLCQEAHVRAAVKWRNCCADDVQLLVDQNLILAIKNHIDNACESGAKIVNCTLESPNRHSLLLHIFDDGPGFNPDLVTTGHSEKTFGLGIGMHLSRGVIENAGGELILQGSEEGGRVTIRLPRVWAA